MAETAAVSTPSGVKSSLQPALPTQFCPCHSPPSPTPTNLSAAWLTGQCSCGNLSKVLWPRASAKDPQDWVLRQLVPLLLKNWGLDLLKWWQSSQIRLSEWVHQGVVSAVLILWIACQMSSGYGVYQCGTAVKHLLDSHPLGMENEKQLWSSPWSELLKILNEICLLYDHYKRDAY